MAAASNSAQAPRQVGMGFCMGTGLRVWVVGVRWRGGHKQALGLKTRAGKGGQGPE